MPVNMSSLEGKAATMEEQLTNRDTGTVVAETLSMIVIDFVAASGNVLVCFVICKTPSLQSKTNIYVLSLALSDLLTSLLVIPLTIGTLAKGEWVFGHLLCEVQAFLFLLLAFVSLHTMALIAVNRYFCVVKPALYRRLFQKKYLVGVLVMAWFAAAVTSLLPPIIGAGGYHFEPSRSTCFLYIQGYEQNLIFVSFCFTFYIFLPFSLMIYCYISVFRTIRRHTSSNSLHAAHEGQNADGSQSHHGQISVEDIKVTRLLFALVLGFSACWVPCVVVEVLEAVLPWGSLPRSTYMTYVYLIYLSSAINPVLYGTLSRPFRRATIKLLPFCSRNVVDVISNTS